MPALLALTSASVVGPAARTVVAPVAAAPAALVQTPVLARISDDTIDPNPSYSFAYDVQDSITGDSKGHIESRANGIVQGQYNVAEPDGTRRIVDYTADPINGFNALVRKEPLVVAAQPVVAARAAKIVSTPVAAPIVARTAPLVAQATPVVARTAPLITQSAPLVAQAAPVVARTAPLVAQTGRFLAQSAPLVAQNQLIAAAQPYSVFGASAPLLARSYNYAQYVNAPLTYNVV